MGWALLDEILESRRMGASESTCHQCQSWETVDTEGKIRGRHERQCYDVKIVILVLMAVSRLPATFAGSLYNEQIPWAKFQGLEQQLLARGYAGSGIAVV